MEPRKSPMHEFVAQCEALLAKHGTPQAAFVNGQLLRKTQVYDTPGLKVAAGADQELEISIKYQDTDGRKTTNPVYCRDANGEVYRTHGEYHFGKERVRRLLAGETPEGPIMLGKGDDGWTAGLD